MKAELPFLYHVVLKPSSGRVREVRMVFASVEVDIPELEEDSAPVVARWSLRSPYTNNRDGSRYVAVRHRDGRFYVRASPNGMMQVSTKVLGGTDNHTLVRQAGALVDYLGSDYIHAASGDMTEAFTNRRLTRWNGEDLVGGLNGGLKIVEANPAQGHAAMMQKARDLVVIGGELWREINEPKLRLERSVLGTAEVVVDFCDEFDYGGKVPVPFHSDVYNLWQSEDMRAHIERTGMRASLFDVTSIEIIDHSPFTFDGVANCWWRVFGSISDNYARRVGEMEASLVADYLAVREARDALRRGVTVGEVDIQAVSGAIARLFAAVPEDRGAPQLFLQLSRMQDAKASGTDRSSTAQAMRTTR